MSSFKPRSRNVDAESGRPRVTTGLKKKTTRPPPPPLEYETESLHEDSDLESELEMPVKDDSRRRPKPAKAPVKKAAPRDNRRKFIKGEEDAGSDVEDAVDSGSSKVAPHMLLMLGATYHLAVASISQPSVSSYIPSCGNMFFMLYYMTGLVSDNTLMHEMFPSFFSPAIYLYYSHVFYYHILRARDAAGHGILTRLEKRSLTIYQQIGQPEAWPIAAPMIGFIQRLGAYKSENPMFGWIVPALPDFSTNVGGTARTPSYGLTGLHNVVSSLRIPIVPAYQEFIRLFGIGQTRFTDGVLLPKDAPLDATHTFCGLVSEDATDADFQSLAFNEGWNETTEGDSLNGQIELSTTRNAIKRWRVPAVNHTTELNSLQNWLGFGDNREREWMSHLLVSASQFNKFFPGSTTLAEISPLTTIGSLTSVHYDVATRRAAANNKWYHSRSAWKLHAYGFTNTEAGIIDTKTAIAAASRAVYETNCFPTIASHAEHGSEGPFFVDQDTANRERHEVIITETSSAVDPVRRFPELLSSYYDSKAGYA